MSHRDSKRSKSNLKIKNSPVKNKKVAVEDLFSAAQGILPKSKNNPPTVNTLLLPDAKLDHVEETSPYSSECEDDDLSFGSSHRSHYFTDRHGNAISVSDSTSVGSTDTSISRRSRYITPKELVQEISLRVERHLVPPEYGTRFQISSHFNFYIWRVDSSQNG